MAGRANLMRCQSAADTARWAARVAFEAHADLAKLRTRIDEQPRR